MRSRTGFVVTATGEHGGTTYRRSPESLVVEQAADILEQVSTDELTTRITEMRDQLSSYQSEYSVDSPEELAVEQTVKHSLNLPLRNETSTPRQSKNGRRSAVTSHSRTPPLDRECSAIR